MVFDRALRRYCESVAGDIRLPRPFSVKALCQDLAVKSARQIYLHPFEVDMAGEGSPCGVWVATLAADHIFFEQHTSQYHQDHIILHEIGHMLCRHTLHEATTADLSESPEVMNDEYIKGMLQRTSYSNRQEREAELVASLILRRVMEWDGDTSAAQERYFGEVLGFL